MSRSDTFNELRRVNPASRPGFERSVEAAGQEVRARIVTSSAARSDARLTRPRSRPVLLRGGHRGLRATGAVLVAAATVAAFVVIGGLGGGGGVQSASAAVRDAAQATATSGASSGTAVVEITYGGELWAGKTVRWHGGDLAVIDSYAADSFSGGGIPSSARGARFELRVVDGMMYGPGPEGGWVELGSPDSIDADSGTTPDEYLAVIQADVTGETLGTITAGMTGLTTEQLGDGSTVYLGTVRAGLVAPETGFKEGQHIRVFPFGYVAHDEAADPNAPLDAAVTVSADGLIGELAVEWGSGQSAWTYTVTYTDLGATSPIEAPNNAQPFTSRTTAAPPTASGSADGN
jgi:hypothetical protein